MNKLERNFIDKFNSIRGDKWEYVSGYVNNTSNVLIKCKECGEIKERTIKGLFDKNVNISCRKCFNNQRGIEEKKCIECGKIFKAFNKEQVICKNCHDKREKERRKANKRLREAKAKNNGKIEWNISLDKLIERDEVCKICGREVDVDDYVITDEGYFIAGENYPSIDHIIPLAKGGTHTWNNVQLVHRHCNSIKCDKIIEQEEEQLKII